MNNVRELPDVGAYLLTVALYRRGDGTTKATLTDMPAAVIDAAGDHPANRLRHVGRLLWEAAEDMLRQAANYGATP